jgi:hypothetical protein
MFEVYNGYLKSSYYIGMLLATPNSFGASPSYVWGAGFWSGFSGGGASFDRTDRTDCALHGWLWGQNNLIGTVTTDGATVNYGGASDARLKDNVRPLADEQDIGATIDAIEPVAFEWNSTPDLMPGRGFIAQDLQSIVPEAVAAGDDDPNKRPGDEGFRSWGVDPAKLVPYLVAELQALRRRVAALEGAP